MARSAAVGVATKDRVLLARACWMAMLLEGDFKQRVLGKLGGVLGAEGAVSAAGSSDDEQVLQGLKWFFAGERLDEADKLLQGASLDPLAARLLEPFKELAGRCKPGPTIGRLANSLFCQRRLPCRYGSYLKLYKLYEKHPYEFKVVHHLGMYQMSLRRHGCFDFGTGCHPLLEFQGNGRVELR